MRLLVVLTLLLVSCVPTIEAGDGLRYDGTALVLTTPAPIIYVQARVKGEVSSPYCTAACQPEPDGWIYLGVPPAEPYPPPLTFATGRIVRAEVLYLLMGERVTRSAQLGP